MTRTQSLIALALTAFTLAACGSVRDDLGLGRASPDEFAVVDRPPLSMPPDFGLRPPQPGAPRPQDVDMSKRANDLLFNSSEGNTQGEQAPADASETERTVLASAGAASADPNIRLIVDREASEKVVGSEHLIDEILWWHKKDDGAATVDATAEAARIRAAKDKGEPLNKGATPIIERQKSSWLGL